MRRLVLLLSLVLAIATTCIAVVNPKDWVKDALIVTEKLIPSVLQENEKSFLDIFEDLKKTSSKRDFEKKSHYIPRTNEEKLEKIREFVNGLMKCYPSLGLTLSIVYGNETITAEGFGVRDLETGDLVDANTLFSIGSTSKAFTSLLVLMGIEDGVIPSVRTEIHNFLPEFQLENEFANKKANFRDLLSHRVGITRHDMMWITGPQETRSEMVARMRYFPSNLDFRDLYQYNNWMFMVAGEAAAEAYSTNWDDLLKERIFDPLKMNRSCSDVYDALEKGNVARSYQPTLIGEGWNKYPEDVERVLNLVGPAGSVFSSATDMAQWLHFHINNGVTPNNERLIDPSILRLLYERTVSFGAVSETMMKPYFPVSDILLDYSLGFYGRSYRERKILSHTGATIGHITLLLFMPNEKLGIFMSGNGGYDGTIQSLVSYYIMDIMLELEPWLDVESACNYPCSIIPCSKAPSNKHLENRRKAQELIDTMPPMSRTMQEMEDYVGIYENLGYGTLEISIDDAFLYFVYNEARGRISLPIEGDERGFLVTEPWFSYLLPLISLHFARDSSGNVSQVTIPMFEQNAPPTFVKIQ